MAAAPLVARGAVREGLRTPPALLGRIALGAALAGVLIVLFHADGAPPTRGPTTAPVTTAARATSAPAPAASPAQSPRPAAFAMTMTDADLTQAAAESFPLTVSGVTVSDPEVRIESAAIRLTATARVLFGTTTFVMTATPGVTDGRITVRVDTATLAGIALPDSTRASITDTVQGTISGLIPPDVRVSAVALAPGRLTVRGTRP